MDESICSVDECDREVYARGACNLHYQRWRRGFPDAPDLADVPRKRRPRNSCAIRGCDKPCVGRGWCSKHWTRWKRYGSPTARVRGEVVDGKRICSACKIDKPQDDFTRVGDSWCRKCFNAKQNARKNATYVPKPKWFAVCDHCGADFMADKRRSIFCSRECFSAGIYRRMAKHTHERRAKLAAVTVESFLPSAVYVRDKWTCGLCGDPIDRDVKYPNPMSPSIDHIVPISRGGEHSLRNVQAAHLVCNLRKGVRTTG